MNLYPRPGYPPGIIRLRAVRAYDNAGVTRMKKRTERAEAAKRLRAAAATMLTLGDCILGPMRGVSRQQAKVQANLLRSIADELEAA